MHTVIHGGTTVPIIQTRPIQVGIIPTWLADKIVSFGRGRYENFLSFSKLAADVERDDSILTQAELNYYLSMQVEKAELLGELFSDIPSIVWSDDNLRYLLDSASPDIDTAGRPCRVSHDMLRERLRKDVKDLMESESLRARIAKAAGQDKDEESVPSLLHYTPLYMDGGVLLLIADNEPVYTDSRSFCDAVLAALGDHYDFTQLKTLQLMRGFLSDHV